MLATGAAGGRGLALQAGLVGLARCLASRAAAGAPQTMRADVSAYGEGATSLVSKEKFRFLVDEPPKLGGKGLGPNPLSLLLGALGGRTQYTCDMVARELGHKGGIGAVAWSSSGEYDLRGVRGAGEGGVDARFRRISLEGTFDVPSLSQGDLDSIAEQVDRRCIVAATLKASGLDMSLRLAKGRVDHECEPACALHDMEAAGGGQKKGDAATGVRAKGRPSREADAPQFAGQGAAAARGFSSLARSLHTAGAAWQKDGEEVARERMNAEAAPQLQKDRSETDSADTAGGAYASRDDPRAQAAQPIEGKSDEQIVQEQSAGAYPSPASAGNAEGGAPMAQPPTQPVKEGQGVEYKQASAPSFVDGGGRGVEGGEEGASDEQLEEEAGRDLQRTEYQPWDE